MEYSVHCVVGANNFDVSANKMFTYFLFIFASIDKNDQHKIHSSLLTFFLATNPGPFQILYFLSLMTSEDKELKTDTLILKVLITIKF